MENLFKFILKLFTGIVIVAVILVALYYIIIYAITDENGDLEYNATFGFSTKNEIILKDGKVYSKKDENNSSALNKITDNNISKE